MVKGFGPRVVPSASAPPTLALEAITKTFENGTRALRGVTLELRAGSVRGLIGANGAGKSTLIKVLGGVYEPTSGKMRWEGQSSHWATPGDAHNAGIHILHQHVPLVPTLSVLENVFLDEIGLFKNHRRRLQEYRELSDQLGHWIPPDRRIEELSVAQRQLVGLLQVLRGDPEVVVLDEPTASLAHSERSLVTDVVRRLGDGGRSILYVSHFLDEVMSVSDDVTVLRDGEVVLDRSAAATNHDELVAALVGSESDLSSVRAKRDNMPNAPTALRLRAVGPRAQPDRCVDLHLVAGEVVGIAGLLGSGRTRLLRSIFGVEPRHGEVIIGSEAPPAASAKAKSPKAKSSKTKSPKAGLAMVPEDRRLSGLVAGWTISENISLPDLATLSHARLVPSRSAEDARANQAREQLHIRCPHVRTSVDALSGGNAQKVVLAKSLLAKPRVVLLDEPTAGVDIGAKVEIYDAIREATSKGMAALLVSSEFEELLALCDRILVLVDGRIVAECTAESTTEHELLSLANSGSGASASRYEHQPA